MRLARDGAGEARWIRVRWFAAALAVVVLSFGEPGRAQPEASAESEEEQQTRPQLAQVRAALASGDQQEALTALAKLHGKPSAEFVAPILDLLGSGATEPVVLAAIDVAKRLGSASLSGVLAPYLQHRSPRVRQVAAEALGATGGAEAVAALRTGLRTRDARLRDGCASALGEIQDTSAVPDLLLALDRGVSVAAISVGRLCRDAECRKLADKIGPVPFDVMNQGLKHVLLGKPDRVKAETKIEIIQRVAELKTPSAAALLRGVRTQWPDPGDPAVTQALDNAIKVLEGK